MFRRIQTKIIVLISLVAAILMVTLVLDRVSQVDQAALLAHSRFEEKAALLDKAVDVMGKGVSTLAYDYSWWDEMLEFVHTSDTCWANENVAAGLPTFGVQSAWIFDENFNLVYSTNTLRDERLTEFPLDQASTESFASRCGVAGRFFVPTAVGLLEVCSGPIQPTWDAERKTPAEGYLFVGRLWSDSYLEELSLLTSSEVTIGNAVPRITALKEPAGDPFTVTNTKSLPGWNGRSVARITAVSNYPVLAQSYAVMSRQLIDSVAFAFLILGAVTLFLYRYVGKPLRQISTALRTSDTSAVRTLRGHRTEFGTISRMIEDFLAQRDALREEVAQKKEAEEEVRKSLSVLQATLESTADGILVVDRHSIIESFNHRFLELWRVPRALASAGDDEALLKYVLSQLKDPGAFLERVQYLYSHIEEDSFEVLEFEDGRYFERYSRPQRIGHEIAGRVWSFRDVTERVQAEKALKESENRFRNLADAAPVMIWMAGIDRHYHYFNQTWLAFTGRPYQQEYGKGWLEGVHPEDREQCVSVYRNAFNSRSRFTTEFRLMNTDGTYHRVLDKGTPRYAPDGEFAGYIGSSTDVTDRSEDLRKSSAGIVTHSLEFEDLNQTIGETLAAAKRISGRRVGEIAGPRIQPKPNG